MAEATPFLRWREHYALGIEKIDRQHQELAGLLNRLYDTFQSGGTRSVLGPTQEQLAGDLKKHFRTEEKLMEESGYPDQHGHVADHKAMARKLQAFEEDFKVGRADLSEAMLGEVRDWLRDHLVLKERPLGTFLASKRRD
jgi:hemerythrin-like metal-binding protein